jgi:hypothetical protein
MPNVMRNDRKNKKAGKSQLTRRLLHAVAATKNVQSSRMFTPAGSGWRPPRLGKARTHEAGLEQQCQAPPLAHYGASFALVARPTSPNFRCPHLNGFLAHCFSLL